MRTFPLKKAALIIGLSVALATTASANIQQQVNAMFGSMTNVTAPGAYQTASLGVVTGGNIVIRNRITTLTPLHISPPSAKGGCGGINMYMGSFSFINAEEFIGMLRNIAANAVGVASAFAFKMAIEAMDSMTGGILGDLQDAMQLMSQAMLNSCSIATGAVEGTVDAFKEGRDLKASFAGIKDNIADDMFASRKVSGGSSPPSRLIASGRTTNCNDTGNILWCAMEETNFTNQFLYGSQENAELIMSMVGTLIVGTGTNEDGDPTFIAKPMPPLPNIDLTLLVEGIEGAASDGLRVYDCDMPNCANPSTRTVGELEGLATKIVKSVRQVNLFERIKAGQSIPAGEMNAQSWLFATDAGVYTRQLIDLKGPDVAYNYLGKHAQSIALSTITELLRTQLDIVRAGLSELEMTDKDKVIASLNQFELRLRAQADTLMRTRYASTDPIGDFLKERETAPKKDPGTVSHGTNLAGAN